MILRCPNGETSPASSREILREGRAANGNISVAAAKRSIEIPEVAASETGRAQTVGPEWSGDLWCGGVERLSGRRHQTSRRVSKGNGSRRTLGGAATAGESPVGAAFPLVA